MAKAHYMCGKLQEAGLKPLYQHDYFNEFITDCPCGTTALMDALAEEGILGGLPITDNAVLWCTTEMNTKEDIDKVVAIAAKLVSGKEA